MYLIHKQCNHLQLWLDNCFFLELNDLFQILFTFFYPKSLMLCKKAVCCRGKIELKNPFDFLQITKSMSLPFFTCNTLNAG